MIDLLRRHPASNVALVDGESGREVTYGELLSSAAECAEAFVQKPLVLIAPDSSIDSVVAYLACLSAGAPVALVEPEIQPLYRLDAAYRPSLVLLPPSYPPPPGCERRESLKAAPGLAVFKRKDPPQLDLHPSLQLLLSTSASTGSAKTARLTAANLAANATALRELMALGPGERAAQSLPLHDSYGLSVLGAHLVGGAAFVVIRHSFLRPEFWRALDQHRCTSFAGTPSTYQTLHKLRFNVGRHKTLRTFTQAGGGLRPEIIDHFERATAEAGARMFVTYTRTEAIGPVAYVPPEKLRGKLGSIGIPIPGGELGLEEGELVFRGPSVMMGYAESSDDLSQGDVASGVLRTGDLATKDDDGFFTIVGRRARMAKLLGKRLQLDDLEREVEAEFPVRAAVQEGQEVLIVYVESSTIRPPHVEPIHSYLCKVLALPPAAISVRALSALPRNAVGRVDYRALQQLS